MLGDCWIGWLILALGTIIKIYAEHCLFSADELLKIRGNEIVIIDSKEIVAFIKNNPNELDVLNFIGNNRKQIAIKDNYKFSLERIINHNGVSHMTCDNRLSHLIADSNEPHHAISRPRIKQRLYKMTGRIMLVHGIHGTIVTCSHQILSVNCILSAGGITTSLVVARLEPIAIAKFAPKIVKMSSRVGAIVGKFIPNAQFAIRLVGTKMAVQMMKTGGAVLGGVFDIADICINIKILVDCKTKGGCSDRDVRDSIVSLSLSGISFIAGVAFATLAMPGVGLVVSLVLILAQVFYSAFSNVFDYSAKYHITFDEGANIFFRSLVFMRPSEAVQMLAKRTDYINLRANIMWETLDNYTETVKGLGIGLGEISIDSEDVRPSFAEINMTSRAQRTLSRVIPRSINGNVEMICLPKFRNEPYENGRKSYYGSAVYYCDNAMVFIHKSRPKANIIVYNLELVRNGYIQGSNEWNNIFQIHNVNVGLMLVGGISVMNHFMFFEKTSSLQRIIAGGVNATNVIDMSNLERKGPDEFTYGDQQLTMWQSLSSGNSVVLFSDTFDPTTDKRIYHYLGRAHSPNTVSCLIDDISVDFLLVNTGGGSSDAYDAVIDCPMVILSPFTTFYSRIDRDKVIFDVQTKGYSGADLVSHIYFNKGQIHILFSEFELTSFDTTMSYMYGEQILLITLQWGTNNKFQLFIHGYDLTQLSFRLFNKKQHMIIPRVPQYDGDGVVAPITFEVFAMCSQTSYQNLIANIFDECIAETVRFYKQLKLLITIQFLDSERHNSFIVGSPYSDIIQFTENITFGKGRNGNDVYSVKEDNYDAIILNYADDNVLDLVVIATEIPRTLSRRNNSLLVSNVEVLDFFISTEYQHIAFIDDAMKQFFPLVFTFEMTPFIHSTPQQNAFFLDGTFNYSHIVLHDGNGDADYEMYRDNYDLLILRHERLHNVSCVITIQNFYIDFELWSNVTWVMYYDNGTIFYRYGFIFDQIDSIIDYKTKLNKDYHDVFVDHFFNSSILESILLENNDDDRIAVLHIDQTISAKNIEITQRHDQHLVLTDSKSDKTFQIENWDSISNRISIIELPLSVEHFEPITVRGFNRFDLNQTAEMQLLLNLAGENYDLLPDITPLTMVGVKCIISNASLSDGEVNSYKCLDFKSIDEQVNFVNKFCEPETLEWFKSNTTMNQTRTTIKILQNNIVLQHVFENSEDNNCEPFFLSVYASDFVVDADTSDDLISAVNDTNKFKKLIENGANPRIRSNDTFNRNVLHIAVLRENLELVKFIVSRQLVDINAYDSQDDTALSYIFKRVSFHCEKDFIDNKCFNNNEVRNLLDITDYLLSESATMKTPLKVQSIANIICLYMCEKYRNIRIFADNLLEELNAIWG